MPKIAEHLSPNDQYISDKLNLQIHVHRYLKKNIKQVHEILVENSVDFRFFLNTIYLAQIYID